MSDAPPPVHGLTRRTLIARGLGAAAVTAVSAGGIEAAARAATRLPRHLRHAADLAAPDAFQQEALAVLGKTTLRPPGSLPNPALPAGTDTLPEIEHVVILMMENHSYDNLLGMLGRGPHNPKGQAPRGDGYTIASDGIPTATNPNFNGTPQRAFHMPTTCQLSGKPSQEWAQAHVQYDNGKNNGFVVSNSGPVAMGYWDQRDLPFTYSLASQFPIGDRWFCSLLGQTDPNRRYLIAATSTGMTDDIGSGLGNAGPDGNLITPANGTIVTLLNDAKISFTDYYTSYPAGTTVELYPVPDGTAALGHTTPIADFFTDAASGSLPSVTLLDPNYTQQSQENPQNIVVGEAFVEQVVKALGSSPKWRQTVLLLMYDEHGGYYDHVPPPVALAPDDIPPTVQPGQSQYDGFRRYGFRVPSAVVSPFAKQNYVSHLVYDHTSVLAFLERKWNLPALTYRDANANDLTDFLDLTALSSGQPTFPELPALAAAGDTPAALACSNTGPGTIPPPNEPPVPGTGTTRTRHKRSRKHRHKKTHKHTHAHHTSHAHKR